MPAVGNRRLRRMRHELVRHSLLREHEGATLSSPREEEKLVGRHW